MVNEDLLAVEFVAQEVCLIVVPVYLNSKMFMVKRFSFHLDLIVVVAMYIVYDRNKYPYC